MTTTSAPALPAFRYLRINRHRRLAWGISGLAIVISLLGMLLCWLNPAIGLPLRPGLDFTGGTQIEVERRCPSSGCSPLAAASLQQRLASLQLPDEEDGTAAPSLGNAMVQVLDQGRSLVLRLPALAPVQGAAVLADLDTLAGPLLPTDTSVNTIGPTLGSQVLRTSAVSLLLSFAAISLYIAFRYDRIFALLALLCLAHDVLIICGAFAWLGLLAGIEVNSLFAVALITVAGYSVNDTVVVFDRIREQRSVLSDHPMAEQVDVAVDATLTRSLYTSFTTLLPVLGLIFFGGSSLRWFAVALALGIVAGSWSSIGVAPTLLPLLSRR
jgi:preprotein translocase subunit SecF